MSIATGVRRLATEEPALLRAAAAIVASVGGRLGLGLDADQLLVVAAVATVLAGWSTRGAVWSPAGHEAELAGNEASHEAALIDALDVQRAILTRTGNPPSPASESGPRRVA